MEKSGKNACKKARRESSVLLLVKIFTIHPSFQVLYRLVPLAVWISTVWEGKGGESNKGTEGLSHTLAHKHGKHPYKYTVLYGITTCLICLTL